MVPTLLFAVLARLEPLTPPPVIPTPEPVVNGPENRPVRASARTAIKPRRLVPGLVTVGVSTLASLGTALIFRASFQAGTMNASSFVFAFLAMGAAASASALVIDWLTTGRSPWWASSVGAVAGLGAAAIIGGLMAGLGGLFTIVATVVGSTPSADRTTVENVELYLPAVAIGLGAGIMTAALQLRRPVRVSVAPGIGGGGVLLVGGQF